VTARAYVTEAETSPWHQRHCLISHNLFISRYFVQTRPVQERDNRHELRIVIEMAVPFPAVQRLRKNGSRHVCNYGHVAH